MKYRYACHLRGTALISSFQRADMAETNDRERLLSKDLPQQIRYGSNVNNSVSSTSVQVEPANHQTNVKVNGTTPGEAADSSSIISFHDVCYDVTTRRTCSCHSVSKRILNDIHGMFKPGMNAVMGATGSGKTTLLDILACRKAPNGLSGTILLDRKPLPCNFRLMVGYVAQDDKVTGTLTVRENIAFSAALRLPSTVTRTQREARVEQILVELGLTSVRDTKVGNDFLRGISGGERKRCSIGMELIISPPLLFLDEPTTGLDASTANAVMQQLKMLALKGHNIIFSIHQPRYSIFRLFDSLLLLSRGLTVYHGNACEAVDFFHNLGYKCDEHDNPADFFLDVINGDSTAVTSHGGASNLSRHKEIDPVILNATYQDSSWWSDLQGQLEPIIRQHRQSLADNVRIPFRAVRYKTNFFRQLFTVGGRATKNLYRNPRMFSSQISVIIVFALVIGAIYYRLTDSRTSAIQNRTGAFFLIIMNQVFGNMSAVDVFIKERAIFIHENLGGFYRVSAYFLAKVFCDVIPMRAIPAAVYTVIAYFMVDLRHGPDHFAIFMLTLFLTSMSSCALAFFFSSTVRLYGVATLCLSLCYVLMMLFGGLLINTGDLGGWVSWLQYFSIFRYSLNALSINELKDREFCGNSTNAGNIPSCHRENGTLCASGNAYLSQQHIAYQTAWDLWWNILALAILSVGFLFLAYVQLRRIKKLK